MTYTPPKEILDKYAAVLVNFALNGEKGVKKGDKVLVQIWQSALPMLPSVQEKILKAGAHPMVHIMPDGISRQFFELASDEQLKFFPAKLLKGRVDEMDHLLQIVAEADMHELEGIAPKKIMTRQVSLKPAMEWRQTKEDQGKLTWTLCLYGTDAMAKEAGLTTEEYWDQIIKACYLDEPDPIATWKKTMAELHRVKKKLDSLKIEKVRMVGADTDITIGIGKDRQWLAATGRNIPTFEIFVSPNWRETEGFIRFNQPLYSNGNLIKDIRLVFKKGKIVQASAKQGEQYLKALIAQKNADKIGEYSLTDGRLSRITKFMAETLFDENMGGRYGNTHLAIGRAYKDSFVGNVAKVKPAQWDKMGFNDSVVHTDIISTEDRTVTATLSNGKELVIYKDGKFTV